MIVAYISFSYNKTDNQQSHSWQFGSNDHGKNQMCICVCVWIMKKKVEACTHQNGNGSSWSVELMDSWIFFFSFMMEWRVVACSLLVVVVFIIIVETVNLSPQPKWKPINVEKWLSDPNIYDSIVSDVFIVIVICVFVCVSKQKHVSVVYRINCFDGQWMNQPLTSKQSFFYFSILVWIFFSFISFFWLWWWYNGRGSSHIIIIIICIWAAHIVITNKHDSTRFLYTCSNFPIFFSNISFFSFF